MRNASRLLGSLALLLAVAGEALGADGAGTTVGVTDLLVGRVNPLGVKDDLALNLRTRLLHDDRPILKDAYAGWNLLLSIKPTAVQLGFGADLQPLSILKLSASVEWVRYFTAFDNLLSFESPRAAHSDGDRESLGESGENYATSAVYISLGVLLQAKLGPVAVRNDLKATWVEAALEPGDGVFYEIEWDMVVEDGGWVLVDNADVVYMADFGLLAGVRYSLSHAVYSRKAFLPGGPTGNPNTPIHRLGPVLGYTFKVKNDRVQKPTILLVAGWYLKHRYRAGQDVSQALPCIVLAFSISGRLFP